MNSKDRYVVFLPMSHPEDKQASVLLCRDGMLRKVAWFGKFRDCIKIYRQKASAIKAARRSGALAVAKLPDSPAYRMEPSGLIIKRMPCPGKPGFDVVSHHSLNEFAIEQ